MKVSAYAILTQAIIFLGKLRSKVKSRGRTQIRVDRVFYPSNWEVQSCCDCGLAHRAEPLFDEEVRDPHYRLLPLRPVGYAYRPRAGAVIPSQHVDESKDERALRSLGKRPGWGQFRDDEGDVIPSRGSKTYKEIYGEDGEEAG